MSNLYGGIILATDRNRETIIGHEDSLFLSTGTQNVAGVSWVYIREREISDNSDLSVIPHVTMQTFIIALYQAHIEKHFPSRPSSI